MSKVSIGHIVQPVKRLCRQVSAAVLILLLFVIMMPSVTALDNVLPVLPDADIPETLSREQLDSHGADARLRNEETDEFTFVFLNQDGTRTAYSYCSRYGHYNGKNIIRQQDCDNDSNSA